MRAIVVDDEPIMIRYFLRESKDVAGIDLRESFTSGEEALEYARNHPIEVAFLDVEMPGISGIELAVKLREIRSDMLIVFISAYDHVRDSNQIGADYYIMKPYDQETLEMMMERLELLAYRQKKKTYMHMFGTFTVVHDGKPVPLRGKAKEILAFIATFRGKEVSNQEIYFTVWEDKPYDNKEMTVYFHALRKLKKVLADNGLSDLLISSTRGQMLNVSMVDCDYYAWQDHAANKEEQFRGEFLRDYPWGELILADLLLNMNS